MLLISYALGFIEFIIALLGAIIAVVTGLTVLIMKLPPLNPVRALLSALLVRLGVSLGGAVVAAPMTTLPGIGEVGDAAIAMGVLYFWLTFFIKLYGHLKRFHFDNLRTTPAYTAPSTPPTITVSRNPQEN